MQSKWYETAVTKYPHPLGVCSNWRSALGSARLFDRHRRQPPGAAPNAAQDPRNPLLRLRQLIPVTQKGTTHSRTHASYTLPSPNAEHACAETPRASFITWASMHVR